MMDVVQLAYYDRRSGELRCDPIYAHGLVDWLYNSSAGWCLTEFICSRRWVSRLYGWWYKQAWSRHKIESFVRQVGVNLDEVTRPLEAFASFNDFIIREIDLGRRPIDDDPARCVAPVDGRVLVYPALVADRSLKIKRSQLCLAELLHDDRLAQAYSGGALLVSRLYLNDYHHFHFPDDGAAESAVAIPGRYYAVSPYSRKRSVPFYRENHRVVTIFESDHFGPIAIIEVGAFTIGSIRQCYRPGARVRRGDHKGFFELGGSIVVLVFRQGVIDFDEDLCRNSQSGVETYVRLGESIGRARGAKRNGEP